MSIYICAGILGAAETRPIFVRCVPLRLEAMYDNME